MTEQPPRPPRPLESSAEPALAAWLRDETLALASLPSPSGTEGAVAERASALARTLGLEARPLRAGDGTLAALVSGSVLFESTFSWPGIGRMAVQAAFQRDYPVLMALNMLGAFLVILGNLIADIAYGWVDPRVRYD